MVTGQGTQGTLPAPSLWLRERDPSACGRLGPAGSPEARLSSPAGLRVLLDSSRGRGASLPPPGRPAPASGGGGAAGPRRVRRGGARRQELSVWCWEGGDRCGRGRCPGFPAAEFVGEFRVTKRRIWRLNSYMSSRNFTGGETRSRATAQGAPQCLWGSAGLEPRGAEVRPTEQAALGRALNAWPGSRP